MFELLFRYPQQQYRAGQLSFDSSWPLWLLVTLLVLLAAFLAYSLWRQRQQLSGPRLTVIWLLQVAVCSLLLLLLWQPVLEVKTVRSGENTVALLLDNSASMQFADTDTPRLQQARELIDHQITTQLADTFTLNTATLGANLLLNSQFDQLPPPANSSNIIGSLLDLLEQARSSPLAAVILASDGNDTTLAQSADFWNKLSNLDIPVHTIGFGAEQIANDVEIAAVELVDQTLPGSVERATVRLRYGDADSARIRVYSGNDLIALDEVNLSQTDTTDTSGDSPTSQSRPNRGEVSRQIDLPMTAPGLQELRFEVEGSGHDKVPQNNQRRQLLQVSDKPRRILYFEGEPRWEYKFMRRAVTQSDGVSLVSLLRTTPNKYYRQGIVDANELANGFPQSKKDLFQYDAVIIGNVESVSLNSVQQQLLHDYIAERGGSLLMLAGSNALGDGGWQQSPLAAALPVTLLAAKPQRYIRAQVKAQLTGQGSYSPITRLHDNRSENQRLWAELPELADFQVTGAAKPGAQVLLTAQHNATSYPLLSYQRYGRGRSFVLATGGTWRWQMQLPHEDQRHEIFWRQLLSALVSATPQRMQLSFDRNIYRDQPQVAIHTTIVDDTFNPITDAMPIATVTAPDGTTQTVALQASLQHPGQYHATISATDTGTWRVDVSSADLTSDSSGASSQPQPAEALQSTAWFAREDGTAEAFALAQDRALLERIAAVTGGQYWLPKQAAALANTIRTSSVGLTQQQSLALWNLPIFFLLLFGCKGLEWLFRLWWRRL